MLERMVSQPWCFLRKVQEGGEEVEVQGWGCRWVRAGLGWAGIGPKV